MILGETDDAAEEALARRRQRRRRSRSAPGLRDALIEADIRATSPARRARPMSAACCRSASAAARTGSSSRSAGCREEIGRRRARPVAAADPGTGDTDAMMEALDLFGRKVLPRIREI